MHTASFGTTKDGRPVTCIRVERPEEMIVEFLDYGATIRSLAVKNQAGGWTDVVLGYDTIREYEAGDGYFGACIGRHANRIGKAQFELNDTVYLVAKNDGDNHLHGGTAGFDKVIWAYASIEDGIRFSRVSPDMEEGYPGNLTVTVDYKLLPGGTLSIVYRATTDQDTVCNLTNHSYFNLNGEGDILGHGLMIAAERFTENDGGCLPTGRLIDVAGTPFDFRQEKPVGRDIAADDEQIRCGGGYDHNFCLDGAKTLRRVSVLTGEKSGIVMETWTTLPGIQLYSGNATGPRKGKGGAQYGKHSALCLETQFYPNAMACAGFEKPVLKAGEEFLHETRYAFSVKA